MILIKAVIYAMVSLEGDSQSSDRQVLDLRTHARKQGLEIVKEFTEKAIFHSTGGKGAKRPGEDNPAEG